MVIREDGSKWACQSCLKGHRVSGCTHTDRPLQFVPKKGRPVTQCSHCRVERKKRSAHVKCECGEKQHSKEKCPHLRHADGAHSDHEHELPAVKEDDSDGNNCCCSHGESCVCFTSKPSTEQTTDHAPVARPKPRLTSTQSEDLLTVFANGHHKPAHRNTHAAHDANMPYRIHKHPLHATHGVHATARRSVDSLVSSDKPAQLPFAWFPQFSGESSRAASVSNVDLEAGFDTFSNNMTLADNQLIIPADTDQTSSNYPQSALSDNSGTFNWDAIDWNALQPTESNQPGLTYASSATISEHGTHTPPDENVLGFNLRSHASSAASANPPHTPLPTPSDRSTPSMVGQNESIDRWSMQAALWLNHQNNALTSSVSNRNPGESEAKANVEGSDGVFSRDFESMPSASTAQDATLMSGNSAMFGLPDYTLQDANVSFNTWQDVNGLLMQYPDQTSLATDTTAMGHLGYASGYTSESDLSEALYGQSAAFYGQDSGEAVDYGHNFVAPDGQKDWSA